MLIKKCIAINIYIKKEETCQISNPNFTLRHWKNKIKLKLSKHREYIVKIRVEISEIEIRKKM